MNVYIAGPMRGIKDFNFPKFHEVAREFRKRGHVVFNPAERDLKKYGKKILKNAGKGNAKSVAKNFGMSEMELARDCFKSDTRWICENADGLVMLPGWKKSKGAKAEHALAEALGLKVIYL